jgi:hypothetical protein
MGTRKLQANLLETSLVLRDESLKSRCRALAGFVIQVLINGVATLIISRLEDLLRHVSV